MSILDELKEWLEEKSYKSKYNSSVPTNLMNNERRNAGYVGIYTIVDAAETGEEIVTRDLKTDTGGVAYRLRFKISDVTIERVCEEHDWGEWQYDFMGGDIRTCKRCNERELV